MTTSRELTTKTKILDVIQRMPEDGTIDDAIYRLGVLKAVAEGLEDAEHGRGRDADEVFDELLNDDAGNTNGLDGRRSTDTGRTGSARVKAAHRGGQAKRRARVRSKTKGVHQ